MMPRDGGDFTAFRQARCCRWGLSIRREPRYNAGVPERWVQGFRQMPPQTDIPAEQIASFCRRNQVRKLWLFGSVLRPEFGHDSDVDVLVEFEPGTRIGYLGMAAMQMELTELLGREVDLRTPAEISRHFREKVMSSAELQYARR